MKAIWKQLYELLTKAEGIAYDYSNPFMNDAGGATDCDKILDHIRDCLEILKNHDIC